jgi:hypothetical protein
MFFPLDLFAGALAKACDLSRTRFERIAAEKTVSPRPEPMSSLGKRLIQSAKEARKITRGKADSQSDKIHFSSKANVIGI